MPRTIKDQICHVFLRPFQTPGRETAGRALAGRTWLFSVLPSCRVQRTEVGAAAEPSDRGSAWTLKWKVRCGLYGAPLHSGEFSGSEGTSATWLRNQLKRTPGERSRITARPFLTTLVGWAELSRSHQFVRFLSCFHVSPKSPKAYTSITSPPWSEWADSAWVKDVVYNKDISGLDCLLCLRQLLRIDPCPPEPGQRRQQPQLLWLADYDHGDHSAEALWTMPANPPPFAFTGTTWEDEEEARSRGSVPANSHLC